MKHHPPFSRSLWLLLAIAGGVLLLDSLTYLMAEGFWFAEVGYLQVFGRRIGVQGVVGLLSFLISLTVLWRNLAIARDQSQYPTDDNSLRVVSLKLWALLPLTLCLSVIVGGMLFYQAQMAISHWNPNLAIYGSSAPVPLRFQPRALGQLTRSLWENPGLAGGLGALVVALLVYPVSLLGAIALLMSVGFALVLSEHWEKLLAALNPTPFHHADPVFGLDIGFYIFRLPLWELLVFWLVGLFSLSLVTVSLVYLLANRSLSDGKFQGFTSVQVRHLFRLGGSLMLAIALSQWLDRYELLLSDLGVAYGASFTEMKTTLPAYTLLSGFALMLGLLLLLRSLIWNWHRKLTYNPPIPYGTSPASSSPLALRPLLILLTVYVGLNAIATYILPLAVQNLVVQPNELLLEIPYLKRAIASTRQAFNLENIQVDVFDPQTNLTFEDLQQNDLTISNIRLWDKRPLLDTNRQLQRIRPYYEFPDADIDRYLLPTDSGRLGQRQVLIAARELDYNSVPAEAQTWVNQHLIYTHGYGFTLSPVNTVGEGGLPDYFVQGIEQSVSDPVLRDLIPIDKPRIYYGELTNTHVMTQTGVQELDYPSGGDNVYNTYDGRGGVAIGAYWKRLLFAKHLRDWRMLLSDELTPQTRLLFRRNINDRVKAIAPFLRYDTDPYLVVADTRGSIPETSASPSYLYWVIDAYTTSDRYPYSDPGSNDFNYIRNSVKVVIDAYHGSVSFYVADAHDPLIQTWSRIFPGMFKPLESMPATLQSHIRYPQDLYGVQSNQLMTYHMTDPHVFYNREDLWRAPNEIYAAAEQQVEPYYLIMKLPIGTSEEFILLRPFAPSERTNLIAWLAARSDGNNYGKMLLYNFPKQELVFGTEQLEARINQDPVISQQISLWNRQGSRAIQGNLLVIPIDQSLLYVEPLYLEAEQNSLPILARVIVAYGSRIVMAETLQEALNGIFTPTPIDSPAIVRPIEEAAPNL